MAAFLDAARVPAQEQPVHPHDAIDALAVHRSGALGFRPSSQQSPDAPIAVRGLIGQNALDRPKQLSFIRRRRPRRALGLAGTAPKPAAMLDRDTPSASQTVFIGHRLRL